jgi:8-oxo-dGTP pyrophosphatase MutT (NUDIX family)
MPRNRQVAALPWRQGTTGIEILMVTTRTTRRWVIPKGWPMAGKTDDQAAGIEAFEEAGVRGAISSKTCGSYGYSKLNDKGKLRTLTVAVYALHVKQELAEWPESRERERRWVKLEDASKLAGEPGLVPVLASFAPVTRLGWWRWLKHKLGI